MRLGSRLVLTTLGVAIPLWLVMSVGYRAVRLEQLDRTALALAEAAIPAGACLSEPRVLTLPGLRWRGGPPTTVTVSTLSSPEDRPGPGEGTRVVPRREGGACGWLRLSSTPRLPWVAPLPVVAWPAGVAVLALWLGLGPVIRRVRRLTQAVRDAREHGAPLPQDAHEDEIGELARAFGATLAAVAERERGLREFVENTSHDLRTPLTALHGHLAALERKGDEDALRGAIREAGFVGRLLDNLALTAKLTAGVHTDAEIDLGEVVSRVRDRFRAVGSRAGLEVQAAWPEEPVWVQGDPTALEQALDNLVDNAVRHNMHGGHVAMVLDVVAAGFLLTVEDDGPGLDPDEIARVMARGVRGDARTRGRGLGLDIVRRVADRHGWTFSLSRGQAGGVLATLEGPRIQVAEIR